jgi:hypothetical protein
MTGPVHMDAERKRTAIALIKAVALLQLKVLIGAARDLALGPLALVAALVDLVFLKKREPHFFRSTLRLGERSDHWIDVWSGARDEQVPSRENVDALIARVEEVVRDPQTGARHARVLKRWAERQVARARQHAVAQISTRLAPPAPPSNRNASPSDPD